MIIKRSIYIAILSCWFAGSMPTKEGINMFVNLTPHRLSVVDSDGKNVLALDPSGAVARVEVKNELVKGLYGIEIFEQVVGEVTGLPLPAFGTYYLVSTMVRLAVPDRKDVLSPGQLVRDESGRPVGCCGLVQN